MGGISFVYKISDTEYIEGPFDNRYFIFHHQGETCSFQLDFVYSPEGKASILQYCDSCNRLININANGMRDMMMSLHEKRKKIEAIVS